jgi:hypothetical protein
VNAADLENATVHETVQLHNFVPRRSAVKMPNSDDLQATYGDDAAAKVRFDRHYKGGTAGRYNGFIEETKLAVTTVASNVSTSSDPEVYNAVLFHMRELMQELLRFSQSKTAKISNENTRGGLQDGYVPHHSMKTGMRTRSSSEPQKRRRRS